MTIQPVQQPTRSNQVVETPPEFISALEKRFGKLDWDLAATDGNAKARDWFTPEQDALSQAWPGRDRLCYLNPPFGDLGRWAAKSCVETEMQGTRILMLSPAGVSTNWFGNYVWRKALVLAINRIRFVGHDQDFPKDMILSVYGFGVTGFDVWRWK